MANIVTYTARPDLELIQMSNGLTSVLIAALSLSSSALSRSDRQRELSAWFAARDQSVYGIGMVSFDVSELPWSRGTFADDRDFILRAIQAALAKEGWERVGYEPREEQVRVHLAQLAAMVEAFVIEHACGPEVPRYPEVRPPSPAVLCRVHRTYQHEHGCVLCNDG